MKETTKFKKPKDYFSSFLSLNALLTQNSPIQQAYLNENPSAKNQEVSPENKKFKQFIIALDSDKKSQLISAEKKYMSKIGSYLQELENWSNSAKALDLLPFAFIRIPLLMLPTAIYALYIVVTMSLNKLDNALSTAKLSQRVFMSGADAIPKDIETCKTKLKQSDDIIKTIGNTMRENEASYGKYTAICPYLFSLPMQENPTTKNYSSLPYSFAK